MARGNFWSALWQKTPLSGGLGRRILLWFLVLSLVPLLLSNSVGYVVSRGIIERQIEHYLRAIAEIQAQQVATEVERHKLYLRGIADANRAIFSGLPRAGMAWRQPSKQEPALATIQAHLVHELMEFSSLSELFVIDGSGTVIVATESARLGEDWLLRELFRRGAIEPYFAVDWETHDGETVPTYLLAVPIRDDQQDLAGVLTATARIDMLKAFLRLPEHPVEDVHAFIVDAMGRPVFISHAHRLIDYGQTLPSPLVDRPPGSMARYVNYEGVDVVGISVAVRDVPWLYITEVSVASALGQLRGLALLAAALESLFALLLVAVVWTVARSIVAPLRRLVSAAESIRRGALGVKVGIERDDELGDLGRTFNQMSGELKSSAREIKELHEQEMRRAAQLASVGELASGIAHEIKNPLVGMASGVDVLSRLIGTDPKSAAILGQIQAQVCRIESAIHDLLSYASPKEPLFTWAEPKQLADRLVALVRPQAVAAGVQVMERYSTALPSIRIDPELMTQALVNLALNAIQAMEPGGTLEVSLESSDAGVRFTISDTGKGIPAEELKQIYRPFYTTKHQGTGLGLAITRAIVERHNGHIEMESEPGEGTSFTLVIPAESQEALAR